MNLKKTLTLFVFLLSPLCWAAPLPVVASFSILGNLVSEVGGDKVTVSTLVGPDQDAHIYQPAPRDVQTLKSAKIVFLNGLGFEGWMPRLLQSAHYKGTSITVSTGIKPLEAHEDGHQHGEHDPHAWQDPINVQIYISNIANALAQADATNAAYYQTRATRYISELKALEQEVRTALTSIPVEKRKIITSHDAFAYLAHRFGLVVLAPQGMNTEAEASAQDVAKLIRQIKTQKIRAVFVENISNPKLIEQLSREAKIEVGGKLYSDALSKNAPANSYLAMYRYNAQTLLAGLRRN